MLCESKKCTGCAACANSCPKACIQMIPDEFGFPYPIIDKSECLQCGKCEAVCPVINPVLVHESVTAYAAMELNMKARMTATSGGVFEVLANWVLAQGGTVFGAAYDEAFVVHHIAVNNSADLERLKGAKYSQSVVGNTFCQVKSLLEQGKHVLYSGTACQIVGLKKYLGTEYKKLLCVDLICHGVPAPDVWQHYVNYRAAKDNDGVRPVAIYQRSKDTGWPNYSVKFEYQNHSKSYPASQDPYMRGFIENLYLRSSCYECIGKGEHRAADFTLGDYWGVEGQLPEMHDGNGTSIVLVHSEKAQKIWNVISSRLVLKEVEIEHALKCNTMAIINTEVNVKAEEFATKWQNEDFEFLIWSLIPKTSVYSVMPLGQRLISRLFGVIRLLKRLITGPNKG